MGTMGLFEKPEPTTITIYTDEYRELVKKASLYDELTAGRIGLIKEPRIIGNTGQNNIGGVGYEI